LYNIVETEDISLQNSLDDIVDPNILKKNNEDDIDSLIELRLKYKQKSQRRNYSYKNEINELYTLTQHYFNKELPHSKEYYCNNDIDVFVIDMLCLNKTKDESQTKGMYRLSNFIHKISGELKYNVYENNSLVNGTNLSIIGFLRAPKQKLNILMPNKNHLLDVINSNYDYLDLYKNLKSTEIITVNEKVVVGDLVRVIEFDKDNYLGTIGYIRDINGNSYKLELIPEPTDSETKPKIIDLELKDDNYIIYNLNSGSSIKGTNSYNALLFEERDEKINDHDYSKLLKNVLQPTCEIIEKINNNWDGSDLDYISNQLMYYDLTIDDITHSLFDKIRHKLNKNNSEAIKESIKKHNLYKSFLKKKKKVTKKVFSFIPDKILDIYKGLYGTYPYYGSYIDSEETRLNWIKTRPDFGQLYFKQGLMYFEKSLSLDREKLVRDIDKSLTKLKSEKLELEKSIETEKTSLLSKKNKCVTNYISKEYHDVESLRNDNNKQIYVDKDKQRVGESNIVPIDSYALLHLGNGKKKIFKRDELSNGNHIWNLESGINLEHIITSNKDFCDQQFKNISELNDAVVNIDTCKFSDIDNSCVSKKLELYIRKLKNINQKIINKDIYLKKHSEITDFNQNLKSKIDYYTYYLNLVNDKQERLVNQVVSKIEREVEDEIDPAYEHLYNNIDLYLEHISKLSDKKRYELLDILIKKYGRSASIANNENPKNIYCKYGNKVLGCCHNKLLINMYKQESNFDDLLNELLETYGVEKDGMYWCNNCGSELFISEYDVNSGFNKNGQRDQTDEIIENEEEENENTAEVSFLLQEHTMDSNIINVFNIKSVLLNIMGIKLNESDTLKLLKQSENLIKFHIDSKIIWKQKYKGKEKGALLDDKYNDHVNIYTILFTSAYLFIILQTSIPSYKINKQHTKCKSDLNGYPLDLDDSQISGIEYMSCLLFNLCNTNSVWNSLKTISKKSKKLQEKIKDKLVSIIKLIHEENYIQTLYSNKRIYNLESQTQNSLVLNNNWKKFRPYLDNFEITNESIDSLDLEKDEINVDEVLHYYSLKYISEIDNIINTSKIENNIFRPAIYQQSCCATLLNNDYENLDFFSKKRPILSTYTKNNILLENKQNISSINNTELYCEKTEYEYMDSFSKIMFTLEEDIDHNTKSELFEHFVNTENELFRGKKRIYDNDTCVITGENRFDLKRKHYTNDDYYNLLKTIQKNNLTEPINHIDSINCIDNLNIIINSNEILKDDAYLMDFINALYDESIQPSQIKLNWEDFDNQLEQEKNRIVDSFDLYNGDKARMIKKILSNIGILSSIFEEDKLKYNEIIAKNRMYVSKINNLQKYINTYLIDSISKIKNSKYDDMINTPSTWTQLYKIGMFSNLHTHYKNDNKIVKHYIIRKHKTNSQQLYTELYNLIYKINQNINKLFSEEHIYDENMEIISYCKFTNENLASLLEYILIIMLKYILQLNESFSSFVKSNTLNSSILLADQDEDDLPDVQDVSDTKEDREVSIKNETFDLLYDILTKMELNRTYSDKFTNSFIKESIDKKSNEEKEQNLKFMEDLEKESRQSLKSMILLGLDRWDKLATKENKEIYFETQNTSYEDIEQSLEETEFINRTNASQELGDGYTEDAYNEWLSMSISNRNEIADALKENIMADDDGDDYNDEDYDGY